MRMGTQWNMGMGGATGFNYSALPLMFELLGISKEDQLSVFSDLQVMERAALEQMAENREDD